MRNATCRDNKEYYCIENKCGGHFASVVAVGESGDEVCNLAEERAKELKIYRVEYLKNFMKEMKPKIEKARAYANIDLTGKGIG